MYPCPHKLDRAATPASGQADNMLTAPCAHFRRLRAYRTSRRTPNFSTPARTHRHRRQIAYSRQFYNANVREYNEKIASSPARSSRAVQLRAAEFFEAEEGAREDVNVASPQPRPGDPATPPECRFSVDGQEELNMNASTSKRRTQQFALDVVAFTELLPRGRASESSATAATRGTSVGANSAQQLARKVSAHGAKLATVEEEADECIYWLDFWTRRFR